MPAVIASPMSAIDAGSGTGSPLIESDASEMNGRRTGAAAPIPKPAPPFTFVILIDNAMLPGAIDGASVPPVTVPKLVLNNAPAPGGQSWPVSVLPFSAPDSNH